MKICIKPVKLLDKTRQDNECRRAQVYHIFPHLHTIHAYHFILLCTQTGRPPFPISSELKLKTNSWLAQCLSNLFLKELTESAYHIIGQTVPNINDPVTKRIFSYIISTHFLWQFEFIASGTTNRVKIKLYWGSGIVIIMYYLKNLNHVAS